MDPSAPRANHFVTDATDESMDCGDGDDLVVAFRDDPLPSCERARFVAHTRYATFNLRPAFASDRAIAFDVPCPKPLRARRSRRCGARFALHGFKTVARRHFSVPSRGGLIALPAPPRPEDGGPDRILLELRYDARPLFLGERTGPYGLQTYLTLPAR